MNWTGTGIVFPRNKWDEVKQRNEMNKIGIYILVGYQENDNDLPRIYIGQADGIKNRIESHVNKKEFWDWAVCFVSNSSGLNRAHVTWLEYVLIQRAKQINRCHLDNSNEPQVISCALLGVQTLLRLHRLALLVLMVDRVLT